MKKLKSVGSFFSVHRWLFIGLVMILLPGHLFTSYMVTRGTRVESDKLLHTAELAAAALDPVQVALPEMLDGDQGAPAYTSITEQLVRMYGQNTNTRWFYLMMMDPEGQIVFSADSIPWTSSDHSLPGEIYADAPSELYEAFSDHNALISAPYKDIWGTQVSAFVPILDRNDQVAAVLGIDIETHSWDATLGEYRSLGVTICALVVLLFLLGYLFLYRQGKNARAVKTLNEVLSREMTELSRATDAAKMNEDKYHNLYASMNEGVALHQIIQDDHGKAIDYLIIDTNPAFEKITGIKTADAAGKKASELYKSDPPPYLEIYAKVADSRVPVQFDTDYAAMKKCFQISVSSPKEGFFATIFEDISENKKNENELRESEEKYKKAFAISPDSMAITRLRDGMYISVNDRFEGVSGYRPDEAIGKSSFQIDIWASQEERQKFMDELNKNGIVTNYETTFKKKHGEHVQGLLSAVIMDLHGEPHLLSMTRDITDRKHAEDVVRQEQALSRAIIDSIPGAFYMLDENGQYVRWNAYQRDEIVGRPEDEVSSVNVALTIHPDDRAMVQERIVNVLKDGKEETVEARVVLRGGPESRWLLMTGRRMIIDQKPYLVGIGIDIDERKKAEQELAQNNERLATLNKFTIDLSLVASDAEIETVINRQIKEIVGADMAVFSKYDPDARSLTAQTYDMESGLLQRILGTLGDPKGHVKATVSDDIYTEITRDPIMYRNTLHDATLGAIPQPVAMAMQALLQVDRFIAVCFVVDKKLYGTTLLALKKDQADPSRAILENYLFLAAVTLRRRQAEKELAESEEKYKKAFAILPDSLSITRVRDGMFISVSNGTERISGYKPEEMVGKTSLEVNIWTDLAARQRFMEDIQKNGLVLDFESVFKKKDGSLANGMISASLMELNGEPHLLSLMRDITERKRAELALKNSEGRFRTMFEQNAAVMLLIEPETGALVDANLSAEQFYGYTIQQLKSMNISGINTLPPEQIIKKMKDALDNTQNTFIFPHRLANGTVRTVEVQSTPITVGAKPILMSIIHDITERKQAEQELSKFKLGFERSADAIFITDREGVTTYVNPSFERVYGFTSEEAVGQTLRIIKSGLIPLEGYQQFWETLLRKEIIAGEITNKRKDGRLITVEATNSPILDEDGTIIGFLGMHRDITERKKTEELVKQSKEKYENLFNTTADAIMTIEPPNWNFTSANEATLRLFDVQDEQTFASLTPGDLSPEYQSDGQLSATKAKEMILSAMEKGNSFFEWTHNRYHGKEFPATVLLSRITSGDKTFLLATVRDVTRQKAAEQELKDNEQLLSSIIENIPAMIFMKDAKDLRFKLLNKVGEQMFGHPKQDIIGKNDHDFFPNEQAEFFIQKDREVLESKALMDIPEEPIQTPDGPRILHTKKIPLFNDQGKPAYLLGISTDITEQERIKGELLKTKDGLEHELKEHQISEAKLQIDEKRLEGLVEITQYRTGTIQELLDFTLNKAIELTDSRIGFLYTYDETTKILKLNSWSKEVMNQCRVMNPQTEYELDKTGIWGDAIRQRQPIIINDFSAPHPHKKGTPEGHVHLDNLLTIPVFRSDVIVGIIGVSNKKTDYEQSDIRQLSLLMDAVWNIVDERRMQDELKKAKEHVEMQIEERTKELQQTKIELQRSLATTQAEATTTKTILQSIGDGVFVLDKNRTIVLANEIAVQMTGFSHQELSGQPYQEKIRFLYEDTNDEDHEFIDRAYQEGTLSETTHHTVLKTTDDLSIPVAGSASPLKDQTGEVVGCVIAFHNITKQREVEKMKDEFVSIASHQLRTPLTALRWTVDLLKNPKTGQVNETQQLYLDRLSTSTIRLISLVNDLLSISRLESGRLQMDPQPMDLKNATEEIITMVTPKANERKIKLEVATEEALPQVNADRIYIQQVIQNLIVNAIKYSPEGSQVNIRLDHKDGTVKFTCQDSGMGIPKAQQEHMFEKFFRADNVLSSVTEGTGLGLPIAKKILDQMQGKIWFETEENQGSTFHFSLPIVPTVTSETKE